MSTSDRLQSLRTAFDSMSTGNPAVLLALFSDDVAYTAIGNTVFSAKVRGRDAVVAQILTPLGAALATPLRFELLHMIADGDRIAVQAQGNAMLRSGAPYNNTYCFVFRFDGTLAAEVTEYLDTLLVTRAFSVPVERAALLRSMDLNMWEMFREITRNSRGGELFETPQCWMAYSPRGTPFHNMVVAREAVDAGALLSTAHAFYAPRNALFSVWTRAHADVELEAGLHARGFTDFISMPGMALLGDPGSNPAAPDLEIRPVATDGGRRDYLQITAEAYATYGAPREYAEDAFVALESVCAPHIQGFVGYVQNKPAAAACVYVTHGVAGIGWVGTVPEYRGRGYGEAVTWAAVREGFRRGGAFANLQASPMGRPVYERMGFITPTEYRVLIGG